MILLNDLASPVNPIVVGLLRSRLHFIASKGLMGTHTRQMRCVLGLLVAILAFAGCTTSRVAERPLSTADIENWSVHVLTWDADGDRRKTRVWIAAVDGTPYIRTTQSRWWHNIERGSPTEILSAGHSYPVAPDSVDSAELRARIDEAFAAKYGVLGRLVIDDERATSNDPYLQLKPAIEVERKLQTQTK